MLEVSEICGPQKIDSGSWWLILSDVSLDVTGHVNGVTEKFFLFAFLNINLGVF